MIGWIRRVFRRPCVQTPDVSRFIARQRDSRADAIQVQRESRHTTKLLKTGHPFEEELLDRPWRLKAQNGGRDA